MLRQNPGSVQLSISERFCFMPALLRHRIKGPYPAKHFTILGPRKQEIDESYVVQARRGTDFKA